MFGSFVCQCDLRLLSICPTTVEDRDFYISVSAMLSSIVDVIIRDGESNSCR